MEEIYLVIDESGAKGYSDNVESFEGEIGLMAGFIVPSAALKEIRSDLQAIRNRFLTTEKVHITDLQSEQQHELREDLYQYIKDKNISCIYEAIYVQGFFDCFDDFKKKLKSTKQSIRSNIKIPDQKIKELLHAALFEGVFCKALAYCINNGYNGKYKINVITDRIDQSIKKSSKKKRMTF